MTAKARHRVSLPVEYVTNRNLAGGNDLTYIPQNIAPAPIGTTGSLRFAESDANDGSGYYNYYKLVGREESIYNSDAINLQVAVDETFGAGKYFIPTQEQWWGIFPYFHVYFAASKSNFLERMSVGLDESLIRQTYLSDYSETYTSNNEASNAVIYAIRFKARTNNCSPQNPAWDYDVATGSRKAYTYPSSLDNSMKCAYRFTRVGGNGHWRQFDNQNLTNQFRIDVVYLGEEETPTILSAISNEEWWHSKLSENKVFSLVFPATGRIEVSPGGNFMLNGRGNSLLLASVNQNSVQSFWNVAADWTNIAANGGANIIFGIPVRLFSRREQ